MKQIEFNGRKWCWNPIDEKLLQVNDWIKDIDIALKYCKSKRTVIQAGGAMGVWPVELAKHFEQVYTFEPDVSNYECLTRNVEGINNIQYERVGLGAKNGKCKLLLPKSEHNNAGTYYTMPVTESDLNGITQRALDTYNFNNVDFIQLDVEGREYEVLLGATDIIKTYKPVIMFEEKSLPQDAETGHVVGRTQKYLESLGYKVVETVHRDVIMVAK
jgi:FkbM family methyltransferase